MNERELRAVCKAQSLAAAQAVAAELDRVARARPLRPDERRQRIALRDVNGV